MKSSILHSSTQGCILTYILFMHSRRQAQWFHVYSSSDWPCNQIPEFCSIFCGALSKSITFQYSIILQISLVRGPGVASNRSVLMYPAVFIAQTFTAINNVPLSTIQNCCYVKQHIVWPAYTVHFFWQLWYTFFSCMTRHIPASPTSTQYWPWRTRGNLKFDYIKRRPSILQIPLLSTPNHPKRLRTLPYVFNTVVAICRLVSTLPQVSYSTETSNFPETISNHWNG